MIDVLAEALSDEPTSATVLQSYFSLLTSSIERRVAQAAGELKLRHTDDSRRGVVPKATLPRLDDALRALDLCVAEYRVDDLSAARSRDVLRPLYQALIPARLRKSLGEFYTPQWLVQLTCDRTRVDRWLGLRCLDPTCGSGAFLLEVIRRKRSEGRARGVSAGEILADVLGTVHGTDLNPLAVQAARLNYLIAIVDLLDDDDRELSIPVQLGDAILDPAPAERFDVVVGNPPWVKWSALPDDYRERVGPICERYGILPTSGYHGGSELDVSGLVTYAVADLRLRRGGVLAFVITQTHFQSQSSRGFRRFCIGDHALADIEVDDLKALKPFPDATTRAAVLRFEKRRGAGPQYPVVYRVWRPHKSSVIAEHATRDDVATATEVVEWEANPVGDPNSPWAVLPPGRFTQLERIAGRTAWADGRKGITADLNGVYMVRIVEADAERGLVRIRTRPEAGRKDIGPAREFWVEPESLYPLLKGARDFSAFAVHPADELYVFIPNRGIRRADYRDAQARVEEGYPETYAYFREYRALLEQRSTYKARQKKVAPFYAIYNVGAYTFARHKVVWAEQSSRFAAAVIGEHDVPLVGTRPVVPDHKVYFADFADEDAAHFACGLLNCAAVREFVESHTVQIQVSDILQHVQLPKYDLARPDHRELACTSKAAHCAESDTNRHAYAARAERLAADILGLPATG